MMHGNTKLKFSFFFFPKFCKTFVAWEQGILNPTLLWDWRQDCMSEVTIFTVVKTECYVNWTTYVSLKRSNTWPVTIIEESFHNAEINQSAVWSVWEIRTSFLYLVNLMTAVACCLFSFWFCVCVHDLTVMVTEHSGPVACLGDPVYKPQVTSLCCLRVFILVPSPSARCGIVPSVRLMSLPFVPLPVHYSLVQPARSRKQLPVSQRMVKNVLAKRILHFLVGLYTHWQPTFGDEQL